MKRSLPWDDGCLALGSEAPAVVCLVGQTGFVTPVDFGAFGLRHRSDGRVLAIHPGMNCHLVSLRCSPHRTLRGEVPGAQVSADRRLRQTYLALALDQKADCLARPQADR